VSDWNSYEAQLTAGYRACAKLTRRHGTTYFWCAALLPKQQRRHVYAIFALCRMADDIVDLPDGTAPEPEADHTLAEPELVPAEPHSTLPDIDDWQVAVSDRLEAFAGSLRNSLASGGSTDPVMAAVVHTVISCGIDPECFDRFFNARAMDLTTTSYESWEYLRTYMEGSAAVIGEMMLPVLEPVSQAAKAPARSLGLAVQLTNFLRDVGEDLDRGRVYLPQDDLRLFDVDLERREVNRQWRAFMAYEIERNRALYSFADTGIAALPPRSARCIGTARVLHSQILDQMERNGYDVFSHRASVPMLRKAATATHMLATGPRTLKRRAEAYQQRSMIDVTQDR
jgi:15-cis-phytoene synthase